MYVGIPKGLTVVEFSRDIWRSLEFKEVEIPVAWLQFLIFLSGCERLLKELEIVLPTHILKSVNCTSWPRADPLGGPLLSIMPAAVPSHSFNLQLRH